MKDELYELIAPYNMQLNELDFELEKSEIDSLKSLDFESVDESEFVIATGQVYEINKYIYAFATSVNTKEYTDVFIDTLNSKLYFSKSLNDWSDLECGIKPTNKILMSWVDPERHEKIIPIVNHIKSIIKAMELIS